MGTAAIAEEFRIWKSDIGTEVRAKYLEKLTLPEGTTGVRLERPDGTILTLPVERLSADDQAFVAET